MARASRDPSSRVRGEGCIASAGPVGAAGPSADDKPDLFRVEPFGGLYYRRRDSTFHAFDEVQTLLLRAARVTSLVTAYPEIAPRLALDDRAFAELLTFWQREGFLDDEFRAHAELRENPPGQGAASAPLITHVELTRACNLRCTHCFVPIMAKRAPDELSVGELHALFEDLDALGAPVLVLAGGEPMIRPDFFEILEGVQRHRMDARLCTNATLINASNARDLVASQLRCFSVSLDGPDAQTHEHLRGEGRFAHALRGVEHLMAAGADNVHLRVTLTPHNIDRVDDFAALARSLGVHRVVFKPFRQSGEAGSADEHHIDRAELVDKQRAAHARWPEDAPPADFFDGMPTRPEEWTKLIPAFGCVGGTTSATITFDGHVTGCGPTKRPDDWTLHTHRFADAWRDAPSLLTWRHLDGNDGCTSCGRFAQCGGGCRIRALSQGGTMNDPDPWAYCADKEETPTTSRSAPSALPILS